MENTKLVLIKNGQLFETKLHIKHFVNFAGVNGNLLV